MCLALEWGASIKRRGRLGGCLGVEDLRVSPLGMFAVPYMIELGKRCLGLFMRDPRYFVTSVVRVRCTRADPSRRMYFITFFDFFMNPRISNFVIVLCLFEKLFQSWLFEAV